MTMPEFLGWREFYRMYPFDDYHRHYRPASLIAASMAGGKVEPMLEWLQPDPTIKDMSDADLNTLKAFGFKRKAA